MGWGGGKGGQVPAQYWILVYWIWLWLVGKSGAKGGGQGDVFVMQGAWKTKRSQDEVFVLTAVMHGVAGDDHRRGHGNGGAAHAELIGDGIICTAAARLASSGSLEGREQGLENYIEK